MDAVDLGSGASHACHCANRSVNHRSFSVVREPSQSGLSSETVSELAIGTLQFLLLTITSGITAMAAVEMAKRLLGFGGSSTCRPSADTAISTGFQLRGCYYPQCFRTPRTQVERELADHPLSVECLCRRA